MGRWIKICTAVAVRKTWVLHKPIKNRPTLAYKNIARKCYEDMFFIALRRPEGAAKGLNVDTIKRFSVWCVVGFE